VCRLYLGNQSFKHKETVMGMSIRDLPTVQRTHRFQREMLHALREFHEAALSALAEGGNYSFEPNEVIDDVENAIVYVLREVDRVRKDIASRREESTGET